ncbi:MAG: hypothetical protein OSA48_11580 [Akkermansiaceae bacterium]|nr:hypothetical protein [Akkermansiaceae bacterium]
MKLPRTTRLCLLAWAALVVGVQGQGVPVPVAGDGKVAKPMTVSLSQQFTVHGGDLKLRTAVAGLAEETKTALEEEVGGKEWKHIIVIELLEQRGEERKARSLASEVRVIPNGFRLQLYVRNLDRGLDQEDMERAVLELLLHERCLREADPGTFKDALKLPWWLTDGLLEAFQWRRQEADKELYQALFQNKGGFGVDRMLAAEGVEEMGAGERAAFRASAGTLVMALLRQEGGKEGMAGMLSEASVFLGQQEALLKQHFPGMNLGQNSLQKWWALQLADLSKLSVTETMNILDSEEELKKVLVLRYEDPELGLIEFRPEQFRDVLALPEEERGRLLSPVSDGLNFLAFRIFPGYRPIIIGYLTVLSDLKKGEDAEIEARMASLNERRLNMVDVGKRTRDFLEWYRINTAEEISGEFIDYLKLKEELDEERSENRGPVSDYLRDMQKIYGKE